MDWFKWLSSSNLDPALVNQYGILFTKNELQEDDIPFFNHEFLQSTGIKIAKHRLEILKLLTPPPTKHKSSSKVLVAAKRTKKSFTKYMLKPWANSNKEDQSQSRSRSQNNALAIVDDTTGKIDYDHHGSTLSRGLTLLKRSSQRGMHAPNKSAATTPDSYYSYKKQQQSMRHNNKVVNTTNGANPMYGTGNSSRRTGSFSRSPFRKDCLQMVDRMNGHDPGYVDDFDFDDGYWSAGLEETKWDLMFHTLKPT